MSVSAKKPYIAIVGHTGRVGRRVHDLTQMTYTHVSHTRFDISCERLVFEAVRDMGTKGVRTLVNCAGDVSVDDAEDSRGDIDSPIYKTNALGPLYLARACKAQGIKFIHISTEYVFDDATHGRKTYKEDDETIADSGISTWYGYTKAQGERFVMGEYPEGSMIIRFSQIQTPTSGLFHETLQKLRIGKKFTRACDQMVSPIMDVTAVGALIHVERSMHEHDTCGIIHIGATNAYTAFDTCILLADAYGTEKKGSELILPKTLAQLIKSNEQKALRPLNSILDVSKFVRGYPDFSLNSVEDEVMLYITLYNNN